MVEWWGGGMECVIEVQSSVWCGTARGGESLTGHGCTTDVPFIHSVRFGPSDIGSPCILSMTRVLTISAKSPGISITS